MAAFLTKLLMEWVLAVQFGKARAAADWDSDSASYYGLDMWPRMVLSYYGVDMDGDPKSAALMAAESV